MHIRDVYIGGWFQRTTLHLSEIYDFLREGYSSLELDTEKLRTLQEGLGIVSAHMHVDNLEYIAVEVANAISLRIYEDGLIVLHRAYQGEDLAADIRVLTEYYEQKLSPAFSYLFSLGAPVPKELANIKTVYPYFVVLEHATRTDIESLLESFGQKTYFEVSEKHFELFRGDKFYLVHAKTGCEHVERFIEEQIFLREFKGQLHRYLNLHRIIWERIAEVKERGSIKGGDIGSFHKKIQAYAKTINLIGARIEQMGTYLHTRETVAKQDTRLKAFLPVIGYRYETLANTLSYIKHIWNMTANYVAAAHELFSSLETQATQNSVKNLTVVTAVGVGGTLIGLLTKDSLPTFTTVGLAYFVALALIGYYADKATGWFYKNKTYGISDTEYDSDIK